VRCVKETKVQGGRTSHSCNHLTIPPSSSLYASQVYIFAAVDLTKNWVSLKKGAS
jgi:hypothetical protein